MFVCFRFPIPFLFEGWTSWKARWGIHMFVPVLVWVLNPNIPYIDVKHCCTLGELMIWQILFIIIIIVTINFLGIFTIFINILTVQRHVIVIFSFFEFVVSETHNLFKMCSHHTFLWFHATEYSVFSSKYFSQ